MAGSYRRLWTTGKEPLYWRHEVSGELAGAVEAYLANRIDGATVTDERIALLRDYIAHWINAPWWDSPVFEAELRRLRDGARELDSATKIAEWIHQAMDIGIDPL